MRTTFRLAVVCLLVLGCTTATTTSQSNGARIRALYDAFARGDVPTVLAGFDPSIVWNEAENSNYGDRNPYRGTQAIVEGVFMRLGADWNNFRINVEQVIDGGDSVVVLGRYTATNKATGQPLNAQFAHVWGLRDGKVVRFQQYTDTAQYARVSGMSR